ncbi:MAG: efflux RND transporter periplasmic adaptor subunit [Akkermansiaceae bacterium]
MKILVRAIFPVLIIVVGVILWKWLGVPVEEPEPEVGIPQKLKTEKADLNPAPYRITLETQGVVKAEQETTITPLVSGTIIRIHEGFQDGAFFKKGQILLELDPADNKTAVLAAESRLARTEAELIQEKARAKQARLNWEDIGYDEEPSPLVLRIPQLRESEANVSAAIAELDQARRNLERTKVKAPFDGRVSERLVGVGQAVGATTQLGSIFGTDTAEIRLPLAPSQLPFVDLPADNEDSPVEVWLTDALGDPSGPTEHQWTAEIVRTEGTLDPDSRELFAIARIQDPFSLKSDSPQLRIGQPLRAEISGITLEDVYVIPRNAVRGMNRIFLIEKEDPKIKKMDITPVWSNDEVIVVRNDLTPGDWLATSRLPYAPNGAPVEIITPPPTDQAVGPAGENTPGES